MSSKFGIHEKFALSQFGAVFAAFFLILQLVLDRGDNLFLFIALGTLVVTIFFYRLLAPLNRLWLGFGHVMGRVIGSFLLGIVFFLFLTPLSAARKLFGGKGMDITFREKTPSFWVEREIRKTTCDDFEKQF